MWFISVPGMGGGTCPRPPRFSGLGSGSRCLWYLYDRQLRLLFLFLASCILVRGRRWPLFICVLSEAEIDMLTIGFRASLTSSCMALFHPRKKRLGYGFIGIPT